MTSDFAEKYESTLPSADFIRREAMVPMRDGTKLYTTWIMKKGVTKGPIPSLAHSRTTRTSPCIATPASAASTSSR
jgi:predicted acyl esterase